MPKRPAPPSARPPSGPSFDVRNPSALAADASREPEDEQDEAVLAADEIGKRGVQTKRNAVKIDGYDSDSSNEGFDARAEAKAQEKKKKEKQKGKDGAAEPSRDEAEADMFADLDEDMEAGAGSGEGDDDQAGGGGAAETGARERKRVKFVDVDDIEGQVASSTAGGSVRADFIAAAAAAAAAQPGAASRNGIDGSAARNKGRDESESESDSDAADSERAEVAADELEDAEEVGAGGKKRHAPRLDAFNLREEKEEGGFDANLNYVRRATDPDAKHDGWMQGVSKREMKRAKEAQARRDEENRRQMREDDEVITADLLAALIGALRAGETVLEALARFGPPKKKKNKKKKPKWQQSKARKQRDGEMDVDEDEEEEADPEEKRRTEAVEKITGAADKLMGRGNQEIYDTEREMLMRMYKQETGEDFAEDEAAANGESEGPVVEASKQWEYRWSDARDGGDVHGPYDSATMTAWNGAGYFGEGVEFREVGSDGWEKDVDF